MVDRSKSAMFNRNARNENWHNPTAWRSMAAKDKLVQQHRVRVDKREVSVDWPTYTFADNEVTKIVWHQLLCRVVYMSVGGLSCKQSSATVVRHARIVRVFQVDSTWPWRDRPTRARSLRAVTLTGLSTATRMATTLQVTAPTPTRVLTAVRGGPWIWGRLSLYSIYRLQTETITEVSYSKRS